MTNLAAACQHGLKCIQNLNLELGEDLFFNSTYDVLMLMWCIRSMVCSHQRANMSLSESSNFVPRPTIS